MFDPGSTRHTLLVAMRSPSLANQQAAWQEFAEQYHEAILAWAIVFLKHRVELAQDVTQDILMRLRPAFLVERYDPARGEFRPWLRVLVRNAVTDAIRALKRHPQNQGLGGSEHVEFLANLPCEEACEELSGILANQPITREFQAIENVRSRKTEKQWQAFLLYAVEKRGAIEVANLVGMTVSNVTQNRTRILKAIREEAAHA